jgi:feruloyl esterase
LKSIPLPDSTVTALELIPAGLAPPLPAPARGPDAAPEDGAAAAGRGTQAAPAEAAGRGAAPAGAPIMLPAYCRVALTLKPSPDSDIKMELWLPAQNWNNKFQMVGNGGWAGSIQGFAQMRIALREGYATAGTDTGHTGADPVFSLGHPEKLVDFAYRAVHETAVKSKTLIKAFYGKDPKLSYWNGCSTGGRQGLMEAQKYPNDFDAVIAGAPADYQTHLHAWDMMEQTAVRKDDQHFVSAPKLAALNKAVLAACDAADGVIDGLLNDPRKCKFDPGTLLCKGESKDDCLTAAEIETVKLMYAPAKKKDGTLIFPGKEPGSETGWTVISRKTPAPAALSMGTFQFATYQNKDWDWRKFDLDKDTAAADEKFGYVNAPADLTAFKNRGGKLLMYHGWSDPAISPENSINLYSNIVQKTGSKSGDWIKLYMIPGMGHCQGGPATDQFNKMAVIERWRESSTAPDAIVAAHVTGNNVTMTRPLCPYPQVATYNGVGSTNDAASFSCRAPK